MMTTDASCGAVNGMHDSFTPLAGLVPLRQHPNRRSHLRRRGRRTLRHPALCGFGGFHCGTDGGPHAGIHRQEDRIQRGQDGDDRHPRHHRDASCFSAITAVVKLDWDHQPVLESCACSGLPLRDTAPPAPTASVPPSANVNNGGPHGLSEILYAYSSSTENNGSAFAGISVNDPWYNLTLGSRHLDRPLSVHDSADRRSEAASRLRRRYLRPAAPSRRMDHYLWASGSGRSC